MAYVDGMVILVGGNVFSMLGELMESALGILSCWATNCGLGINSNKTDLFLYSRRYKIITLMDLSK